MNGIIVLAAGVGHRFGGSRHKATIPLMFNEGALRRLIRQLTAIAPSATLVVVTGYQATLVQTEVQAVRSDAHFAFNPNFYNSTVLESINSALEVLDEDERIEGSWVLFADTTYDPTTLDDLLKHRTELVTVIVAEQTDEEDNIIGVRFNKHNGRLIEIGPNVSNQDGLMLPLVYWPRSTWLALKTLAENKVCAQWRAIQLMDRDRVSTVTVGKGTIKDIDRPADLLQRRKELFEPRVLQYFTSNISKDERNKQEIDLISANHFAKLSSSPTDSSIEASALRWLGAQGGERLVPTLFQVKNQRIVQEYVQGIRLYDFLRLLRDLEGTRLRHSSAVRAFSTTILDRCLHRLARIQSALVKWSTGVPLTPYPLETHLLALLGVIFHLLGLPPLTRNAQRELSDIVTLWNTRHAITPFRDATPKNILLVAPELRPTASRNTDERLDRIANWIECNDPSDVRIVDYDFSSTQHLTAPEDDYISLLAHRGSRIYGERLVANFCPNVPFLHAIADLPLKLSLPFDTDHKRMALALLIRFCRFGGRKLLYRIINPAGYTVRFRYDDPLYYFQALPGSIQSLDPDFNQRWPSLFHQLTLLADTLERIPSWDPAETDNDFYLQSINYNISYWQESPEEIQGAPKRTLK